MEGRAEKNGNLVRGGGEDVDGRSVSHSLSPQAQPLLRPKTVSEKNPNPKQTRFDMRCVVLSSVVLACGVAACAQTWVDSLSLGYTGTVTRYDSLQGALSGTGGVLAYSNLGSSSRDLQLQINDGMSVEDGFLFGTAWWPTVTGQASNPNDVAFGFAQLYDPGSTSVASLHSSWDAALTTYSLQLSGANALATTTGGAYQTRLWNATDIGGSESQGGAFRQYEFTMTAQVDTAAHWDSGLGMYVAYSDPTAVTGSLRGVFENTSGDGVSEGFYAFDLSMNLDSWLWSNRADSTDYHVTALGSAIPEPSTYALLLGAGTLFLAAMRRRRKRII